MASEPKTAITLIGMSGVGKTYLSDRLRKDGWFHYSADYRIGTRYIDEAMLDDVKIRMMRDPYLKQLLRSDSIFVSQNISMDNLSLISSFLGMPGDVALGGRPIKEFLAHQTMYANGEKAAAHDLPDFVRRAEQVYGYPHFVHDSTGSLCEVIDVDDPNDPVWRIVRETTTIVWIKDRPEDRAAIIARQHNAPKPIYYNSTFFDTHYRAYCAEHGSDHANPTIDPFAFLRDVFPKVIAHRTERYAKLAALGGIIISPEEANAVESSADMLALLRAKQSPAGTI